MYVFSPELVTEEDFTITDNLFEGNVAESGGGIILGATFQQTNEIGYLDNNVFTDSVTISRISLYVTKQSVVGQCL